MPPPNGDLDVQIDKAEDNLLRTSLLGRESSRSSETSYGYERGGEQNRCSFRPMFEKEDMDRSFRFGSRNFGIFAGVFLLLVFIFVFFMSTVPDPTLIMQYLDGTLPQDAANPILTLVYNVLGVVVFMGIAWICWNRYEKKLNQK